MNTSQQQLQDKNSNRNSENYSNANKIKILTYNLFLRPPFVKNNIDDYKNERCKEFLKSIDGFDIICLQEVFGLFNQRKYKLIYGSMKQGFYYHASSPDPSFFSSYIVDGGLLTLSRFPIVYQQYKAFSYGVLSDNLSQKGVLYTKIMIQDKKLHLFNSHLQASYIGDDEKVKATVLTRIDQLKMMKNFVDDMLKLQKYQKGDLVLILGDYNVDRMGSEHPIQYLERYEQLQVQLNIVGQEKFNEYFILEKILSNFGKDTLIDCMLETSNKPLITYGDVIMENDMEMPMETALTLPDDWKTKQSLDYFMKYVPNSREEQKNNDIEKQSFDQNILDKSDYRNLQKEYSYLEYINKSIEVEKFLIDSKEYQFTQLSDHYGLSGTIEYIPSIKQSNIKIERDLLYNADENQENNNI